MSALTWRAFCGARFTIWLLLTPPLNTMSTKNGTPITRATCRYEEHSQSKFLTSQYKRTQQYYKLYALRLNEMREQVLERAQYVLKYELKDNYGLNDKNVKFLDATVDLNEDAEEDNYVVVIGTLFKDGKLKPSILDEYTRDYVLMDEETQLKDHHSLTQSYISPEDQLFLEDNHGRISLIFNDDQKREKYVHETFSGVVVAAFGKVDPRNSDNLITEEIIFPGLPLKQNPRPTLKEDKYIAFVSGLEVDRSEETRQKIQLIVRYLAGLLGSEEEKRDVVSRIARLVVVGNCVGPQEEKNSSNFSVRGSLRGADMKPRVGPSKTIDHLLSKLGASMDVDIMPGKNDPTNVSIPQQPINRCMFEACSTYNTINLVTNPYDFSVDGVDIMGVAGQPVDDVRAYTRELTPLEVIEKIMTTSHFAPTTPDTLDCYPYADEDPLIMDRCPHVFFAGNQDSFDSKVVKQGNREVLCLSLPSFYKKANIVLVNLRDLQCRHIEIE